MNDIFEYAVRNKLRFPYKGQISVEDLWDLTPEALDVVFRTLSKQSKQNSEESLMTSKSAEDTVLNMQIEIVKYIFSAKINEAELRKKEMEAHERRQKIMSIIDSKQEADLQNKSIEELKKMLDE